MNNKELFKLMVKYLNLSDVKMPSSHTVKIIHTVKHIKWATVCYSCAYKDRRAFSLSDEDLLPNCKAIIDTYDNIHFINKIHEYRCCLCDTAIDFHLNKNEIVEVLLPMIKRIDKLDEKDKSCLKVALYNVSRYYSLHELVASVFPDLPTALL